MIDYIKQLMDYGAENVIIIIVLGLLTASSVIQLVDNLRKRFGVKTKWTTKEEERERMIRDHECKFQHIDASLQKLQIQREQDVKNSKEHDRKIEEKVSNIAEILLDEQIDTKRNRILNFANSLQNGKHQDKDQFDFIFLQYDKYEKILKTHKLENGQVTASMDYIKQIYQEKLKNGF